MKKTFFTLLAFTAITLSATAQQQNNTSDSTQRHPYHQGHRGHGMEMKALNLTAEQKAKLKAYNQSYRAQMDSLQKNESISVKESRDQQYALRQQRKANFESILTAEQKAKLKEFKDQRMAQRDSMATKHMDKLKTVLGLTDEQVAQIHAQREAIQEKLRAVKDNDQLTREEKQAQLESIKTERKAGLAKILTPDQLSKLEQLKQAHRQRENS